MYRYLNTPYRRCGDSGLLLPPVSLGLWHNFGGIDSYENGLEIIRYAFDRGITHFDLANNYGPPAGSAEENFGKMLKQEFGSHRDEMIITTKAGHRMWEGPYGDGGSRKYIMASIDQSLKRLGTEYVDIFYSHRYDPETPLEETLTALCDIVRRGKALYIGLSKYPADKLLFAFDFLKNAGTPCIVYQDRYNLLSRGVEEAHLQTAADNGSGFVAFSPLAQGLLTGKYIQGIPKGSRADRPDGYLKKDDITPQNEHTVSLLQEIARTRNESISQMALAWLLQNDKVTSVIVGARNTEQLKSSLNALDSTPFSAEELSRIEKILKS
ncbi:aldo/keto reductase [Coprobacter tertius]|uniref:Aldo/keto reductase n=1 Tax=Coprobacter tertius TaxID=2944915 RepID=A0ABT1MDY6_9BACT|nr:aldo/keto reductase [Coprobacter tertius]MCP9610849.1 aldo/keto reductase [Coprobacter tertius]